MLFLVLLLSLLCFLGIYKWFEMLLLVLAINYLQSLGTACVIRAVAGKSGPTTKHRDVVRY